MLHLKNQLHQLLDMVVEVTHLLELSDRQHLSWSKGNTGECGAKGLLISLALIVTHLMHWRTKSDVRLTQGPFESPGTRDELRPSPAQKSPNRHWYPAKQPPEGSVSFDSLQRARLMLFYWAVVLKLEIEVFRSPQLRTELYHAWEISDAWEDKGSIEKDIRAAISIDVALDCADNIVRWFEFAAQNVWNSFGPAFGVDALKTAISWYQIYQQLPRSQTSRQADRSDDLQQAENMLFMLVNVGSPPTRC